MEKKNKNYEIELKFKINNSASIRRKLKAARAKFLGKAFERTTRFDTPDRSLEKSGKFLRLRTGFKNTMTFKQKIEGKNKEFKEREEIEFEVLKPEEMNTILQKLGFTKILIMEKYREKWEFNDTEVVIDKLPMGTFIEIEGEKEPIKKVVDYLGLEFEDRITGTYWDIWREFSEKEGIKDENIVFK